MKLLIMPPRLGASLLRALKLGVDNAWVSPREQTSSDFVMFRLAT